MGKRTHNEIKLKGKELKFIKRENKLKGKLRSLDLKDWVKHKYYKKDWWPKDLTNYIQNINYDEVEVEEFYEKFGYTNTPVLINGIVEKWNAYKSWNFKSLKEQFNRSYFKVGEDDDENPCRISLRNYEYYLNNNAKIDDSPLYIFESNFSKDKKSHGSIKLKLLDDYFVPKYFSNDLFALTGKRRPPYRWWVCGPERSGTGIHVDPLGSCAWNALILGHKRWVLFPPSIHKELLITPKGIDKEAVSWFNHVYPRMKFLSRVRDDISIDHFEKDLKTNCLANSLKMIEFIQNPGQIVFVPSGWHHVVLNLDFTIAITHNFTTIFNLEYSYLKSRFARPRFSSNLENRIKELANYNPQNPHVDCDFFKKCINIIDSLKTCPSLFTSSSPSSSSSSDYSSSSSSNHSENCSTSCKCKKCLR